jgi:flavin reductase (DIM6/NTAB) family NADH-FMN oxidoreductase RutF
MTNIMALSWWTYVSNKPATIAICVGSRAYTGILIQENLEFGLCVVDQALEAAAFKCGTCSGRDVNKAEAFGIELMQAEMIAPRLVKAHSVALECRVISSYPVHDHRMFVAEVNHSHINPHATPLFALDGYRRLGVVQAMP